MNRKELEHSIRKLDDAVEFIMDIEFKVDGGIMPHGMIEDIQSVVSLLEEEYRFSEDEWEDDDDEPDMG